MRRTASSKGSSVAGEVFWTPLTFRTYWRAAASISSDVASGSRPRRVVILRHMGRGYRDGSRCRPAFGPRVAPLPHVVGQELELIGYAVRGQLTGVDEAVQLRAEMPSMSAARTGVTQR